MLLLARYCNCHSVLGIIASAGIRICHFVEIMGVTSTYTKRKKCKALKRIKVKKKKEVMRWSTCNRFNDIEGGSNYFRRAAPTSAIIHSRLRAVSEVVSMCVVIGVCYNGLIPGYSELYSRSGILLVSIVPVDRKVDVMVTYIHNHCNATQPSPFVEIRMSCGVHTQ